MADQVQPRHSDEARRRRPRAARACQFCRSKKYKCDELRPCTRCKHLRVDCVYDVNHRLRHRPPANPSGRITIDNGATDREFHGQTSSMAFLAALDPDTDSAGTSLPQSTGTLLRNDTFVPTFHDDAFSPVTSRSTAENDALFRAERYHFKHSRLFLEGHFQNIHFVHPILDQTTFMDRCEDLWFGPADNQPKSFVALYYSVMSLGALVRTWDDGETVDGQDRLQWSRKLFVLARLALDPARLNTDLETIQTCFFLAKVCQNELNPSLAYMYLGLAARAGFTAGINRQPRASETMLPHQDQVLAQRTWWGLYALEVELSFALGRPDSLGPDQYHNVALPQEDTSEVAIIPILVRLARIIRRVCTNIYLSDDPLDLGVDKALSLDRELDEWIMQLPELIRPVLGAIPVLTKITRERRWVKLQQIVLSIRYYNVKMVLLRPFLARGTVKTRPLPPVLSSIIGRCVDAGRATITQLHDIYINQPFFRTWWNNTTYVLYAASTVLWYTVNIASANEAPALLDLGEKAIEILEAMEECVVARKACQKIKGVVAKAQERFATGISPTHPEPAFNPPDLPASMTSRLTTEEVCDLSFHNINLNLDFFDMTFPMDEMRSAFWTGYDSRSE